ncbi:dTMP kinase [Nosocomiicoccus sp. HMSC059G07]|uniref:dTMP kinase n=1 Tax=Nosocomiicoccus sp. HMSC059G07 TaxID=1739531 RepID=UPI0008A30319|nr:dTMP kinase [Nosocomiicoccus sp. HMSC059G07]OFO50544.1 dTMP kinase [Nosocomiicoccus sp. HMSC059G07]
MGIFITFEGPEGSGKSTIIKGVNDYLLKHYETLVTREPGGIPLSESIRDLLLDETYHMDGHTEALLFAASRRVHLVEKILPALNHGKIVLCDRFIDSSLAYQGYARGLGFDPIFQINKFAIDTHMPDLTIYLKLDPKIGLLRKKDNDVEHNRLDNEEIDFHERVVMGYNKLSEQYPERIKTIDANQDIDAVLHDTIDAITQFIKSRGE